MGFVGVESAIKRLESSSGADVRPCGHDIVAKLPIYFMRQKSRSCYERPSSGIPSCPCPLS